MKGVLKDIAEGSGCPNRKGEELTANLKWRKSEQRPVNGGALVGRLISERVLNRLITIQMIRKGWNLERSSDLEVTEMEGNVYIFEFRRKEDYCRILRGRPWSIQGIMLNIQPWSDSAILKEIEFQVSPFWIQFHDIPLAAIDIENAITLGSMIGEVLMVENPRRDDLLVRGFLRAKVLVDLRKPLVTGIWVPRPNKEPVWVKVRYKRLQNFCYRCGRVGHDRRCCPTRGEEESDEELRFGNWLGIQAARPIKCEIICCKRGWEEYVEAGGMTEGVKGDLKDSSGKGDGLKVKRGVEEERDGAEQEGSAKEGDDSIRAGMNRKEGEVSGMEKVDTGGGDLVVDGLMNRNCVKMDSKKKDDLSKAIVLYGTQSPVSEVMSGLRRIKLKRSIEIVDDREMGKRRRLDFPLEEMSPVGVNEQIQEGRGRNSGRVVKRQIRRGSRKKGGLNSGDLIGVTESKVGDGCLNAEGVGGWPETATKEK